MDNKTERKNLHSGHRKRVRAGVIKNGCSYLEDHQLLELLLFHSIPQADTNELAHRLLSEFGSLKAVFEEDIHKLQRVSGVGENTAVMISAMGETFKRISKTKPQRKLCYKTEEDYKNLVLSHLSGKSNEKIILFCFDSAKRLKKECIISEGDEVSATLNTRRIVQSVVDCDASYSILAHNHPSATCEPSAGDIDSTRAICVMLRKIGFILADHFIVGYDNSVYSMRSDPMFSKLFN